MIGAHLEQHVRGGLGRRPIAIEKIAAHEGGALLVILQIGPLVVQLVNPGAGGERIDDRHCRCRPGKNPLKFCKLPGIGRVEKDMGEIAFRQRRAVGVPDCQDPVPGRGVRRISGQFVHQDCRRADKFLVDAPDPLAMVKIVRQFGILAIAQKRKGKGLAGKSRLHCAQAPRRQPCAHPLHRHRADLHRMIERPVGPGFLGQRLRQLRRTRKAMILADGNELGIFQRCLEPLPARAGETGLAEPDFHNFNRIAVHGFRLHALGLRRNGMKTERSRNHRTSEHRPAPISVLL